MAKATDKFFKKILTTFDKMKDKNDEKMMRLNNPFLLLGKDYEVFRIWVVFNKKTEKWLNKNVVFEIPKNCKNFAVDLEGNVKIVEEQRFRKGLKTLTTYNYYGMPVEQLFSHSNKSKKLFWVVEKFDTLNAYDGDDKLTLKSLKALEEMINEEFVQKQAEIEKNLKSFKNDIVNEKMIEKSFEEEHRKHNKKSTSQLEDNENQVL